MPPKSRKKKDKDIVTSESKLEEKKEEKKILHAESEEQNYVQKSKVTKELNSEKNVARRIIVNPAERWTSNVLIAPEVARLIATRAEMYAKNQISFIKITTETDEECVAIRELLSRRFPLMLARVVAVEKNGDEIVEMFDPNEMTIPDLPIFAKYT